MATTRRMTCDDLFRFNTTNLDPLTETVRQRRRALAWGRASR
jgi:hypothetical protein